MVLEGAEADTPRQQQQDHHGYSDEQRRGERSADRGAVQQHPLARQQQYVLPSTMNGVLSACRGAGGNFAAMNLEEALTNIWALEDADAALDAGVVALPLPAPPCRKTDEVLLEIQRDQPHLHQYRSSENAHGRPAFGAMPLGQHPLYQQQLQSQFGNGMPGYALANEQQRHGRIMGMGEGNTHSAQNTATGMSDGLQRHRGRDVVLAMDSCGNGAKTAGNYRGGGLGFVGGDWGVGMAGSQMGAGSPKSSISSDGSGGDMGGSSPASVWEVGMRRGASKEGGGGDSGGGGGGRKRTLDEANEDFAGLWQSQTIKSWESSARLCRRDQSIDGLKQLFLCANMEPESPLATDREEIRNKEERVKQLLQLLRVTSLERDEARDQLQRLLNKAVPQPSPLQHAPSHLHPDALPFVSSPLESLFDPASSPELPNKVMAASSCTAMAQQPALLDCAGSIPPLLCSGAAEVDPASALIDRLVVKRALPEKGKLLQAVMEAGPLLQTLLVAGSLPRWRNPPPLQSFQIPPVSVRGRESGILHQNATLNQNYLVQSSAPKTFHHHNSLGASQFYAASSPGSSGLSAFCLRGPTIPSTCASSYQGLGGKRQKF